MLAALLTLIRWLCLYPREALAIACTLWRAHRQSKRRGGQVTLLCRDGGIGDVLWAAAAAQALANQRPQNEVLFLTRQDMRAAAHLAAPDLLVIHAQIASPVLLAVLRRFISVCVMDYEAHDQGRQHFWQAYLQQLGCSPEAPPARWHFTPRPLAAAEKPIACVYAGPSWAVRELPQATWSSLVQHLHTELNLRVVQVLPAAAEAYAIPGVDDFAVGESLPALCNLFDQSAVVIIIDSVMLHLAAGTRAPLVGLFGATTPASRLHPSATRVGVSTAIACAGCHHRPPRAHWESGCPHHIQCMKQLEVSAILHAVRRVIAARP